MMEAQKMTRREAAQRGFKTYYTGVPCKRGHDDLRYTATGNCKRCNYEYTRVRTREINNARFNATRGVVTLEVRMPEARSAEIIEHINTVLMSEGYPAMNKLPGEVDDHVNPLITAPLPPTRSLSPFAPPPPAPVYEDPVYTLDFDPEIEARIERNRREKEAIASQIAETRRQMEVLAGIRDPLTWLNDLGDPK